jgi:hypothetical protein
MIKDKICYALKECAKKGDDIKVEFLGDIPELWIITNEIIFKRVTG